MIVWTIDILEYFLIYLIKITLSLRNEPLKMKLILHECIHIKNVFGFDEISLIRTCMIRSYIEKES